MTALQAASRLADDLAGIFGARLRAVLVYGTHARAHPRAVQALVQTLALVDRLEYADLSAGADRAAHWQALGLDMPLLLPEHEFRNSLDAFPLEYGDILAHHIVVRGESPFAGLSVAPDTRANVSRSEANGPADASTRSATARRCSRRRMPRPRTSPG